VRRLGTSDARSLVSSLTPDGAGRRTGSGSTPLARETEATLPDRNHQEITAAAGHANSWKLRATIATLRITPSMLFWFVPVASCGVFWLRAALFLSVKRQVNISRPISILCTCPSRNGSHHLWLTGSEHFWGVSTRRELAGRSLDGAEWATANS
jgi:hypothetical protein